MKLAPRRKRDYLQLAGGGGRSLEARGGRGLPRGEDGRGERACFESGQGAVDGGRSRGGGWSGGVNSGGEGVERLFRSGRSMPVWGQQPGSQGDGPHRRVQGWRRDGEVSAGRGRRGDALGGRRGDRPRPEGREQGGLRAGQRRRRSRGAGRGGGGFEPQRGGDGERPRGRRSQRQTLQHLSSEQHLVLPWSFEAFPEEQGLLGHSRSHRCRALIGSGQRR